MKHLVITLLLLAVGTLCGWAAPPAGIITALSQSTKAELAKPHGPVLTEGTWTAAVAPQPSRVARKAGESIPAEAKLAEINVTADGTKSGNRLVTLVRTDSVNLKLQGLAGIGDIKATYDLAAGTISIKPAMLTYHDTYGSIYAVSLNADHTQYSTRNAITGTIGADGSITLKDWGVVITSGTYKGQSFGMWSTTELLPVNATMADEMYNLTTSAVDSTDTYSVRIDQTADNQLRIANFSGNGAVVNVTLNGNDKAQIAPQYIAYYTNYGEFYCYAMDWTTRNHGTTISATCAPGSITTGSWAVLCNNEMTVSSRRVNKTVITFPTSLVTYPTALTQDWTGTGTEADPYIITTPNQLLAFGESVNGGTTYEGKTVALGADIDLSAITRAWRPIGLESAPFQGTLDGRGHAIKNLTYEMGQENNVGIIGYAGASSVVKNLTVSGLTLTSHGRHTGGVVGQSQGTITGVTLKDATITHRNYNCGGIVGRFAGKELSHCSATATINGQGNTALIVGQLAKGAASFLESHGTVTVPSLYSAGYAGIGGIAAHMLMSEKEDTVTLTDSYNDAFITDNSGYGITGGLAGYVRNSKITRCYNVGHVATRASASMTSNLEGYAGGLVGQVYGTKVRDCYNAGGVVCTGSGTNVGGLVGYITKPSIKTNRGVATQEGGSQLITSYTSGQVITQDMTRTQGLYGWAPSDSVIINSYFDQQMTGNTMPDSLLGTQLTTAQLITGDLSNLKGFSSSVWTTAAGLYPALTTLAGTPASDLSIAPIKLVGGENTRKVRKSFTVSSANGITWKAQEGGNLTFVTSTVGFDIKGDSVVVTGQDAIQDLCAVATNGIYKRINIQTVDPIIFKGGGTKDDPYRIENKEDLQSLADGVRKYHQPYRGDYFLQTADIDLEGSTSFQGIGPDVSTQECFGGIYDGGGHSIHNMKIDAATFDPNGNIVSAQSRSYVAFVTYLAEGGVIKNLTIAADCQLIGMSYVAPFVGYCDGSIVNCRNYAPIVGYGAHASGIAGLLSSKGSIEQCYNSGTVRGGGQYAAGIVGRNSGRVIGCQNDGAVSSTYLSSYYSTAKQNTVAGIAAYNNNGAVVNGNVNTGTITATSIVGGIIALSPSSGSMQLKGNLNYGAIIFDPADKQRGTISASLTTSGVISAEANAYDAQLGYMGAEAGVGSSIGKALTTAQLTSGKAVAGLPDSLYDFQPGQYPVLKAFAGETSAQAARKAIVNFADGQTSDDVRSAATIAAVDGQSAKLTAGTFTLNGTTLTPAVASATQVSVRDTLSLVNGAYSKLVPLRTISLPFTGAGTEADPFQIKTPADMATLAQFTNEEKYPFNGRYFRVMNDIDFTDATYTPVANEGTAFNATFLGDGRTFTNLKYSATAKTDAYRALFGIVGPEGSISRLTLADNCSITGYEHAAGFVGYLYGTIDSCTNKATINASGRYYAAGIAATVMGGGQVLRSTNAGQLSASYGSVAGIACDVNNGGRIEGCQNVANITSTQSGLVGIAYRSGGFIGHCVNRGELTGKSSVAGIVGTALGGDTILACSNVAPLKLSGTSSGIAGIICSTTRQKKSVIDSCFNTATIEGRNAGGIGGTLNEGVYVLNCYNTADITSTSAAGGIICTSNASTVHTEYRNCYNTGNVTGASGNTGGFGGNIGEAWIFDCYNTGKVVSTKGNAVGGLFGQFWGTATHCYNTGDVEAAGNGTGGVSGIGRSELHECFNLGNITTTAAVSTLAGAGGVQGYGRCKIYDCYNAGDVTANGRMGGIIGEVEDASIATSYNVGTVTGADSTLAGAAFGPNVKGDWGVTSCYYDVQQVLARIAADTLATGLTTLELTKQQVSDAFDATQPGMYPQLSYFKQLPVAQYSTATLALADGDSYEQVTKPVTIGVADSVTWTYSSNLSLAEGQLVPTAIGEAWATKSYGRWSKTWHFNVTALSGVNDVPADGQIVSRYYYSISGLNLGTARPTDRGVYVERVTYSNGRTAARKILIDR